MSSSASCLSRSVSNAGDCAKCRMEQAPKDDVLGPQASFDSLNGSSDDDAFSEVTGISKRSAGWGSLAGFHGAERHVSRFFRRFIPSHTTAQTGQHLDASSHHTLLLSWLMPSSSYYNRDCRQVSKAYTQDQKKVAVSLAMATAKPCASGHCMVALSIHEQTPQVFIVCIAAFITSFYC